MKILLVFFEKKFDLEKSDLFRSFFVWSAVVQIEPDHCY